MNAVVDEKTFWSKLLKDIDPVIKIAEYDIYEVKDIEPVIKIAEYDIYEVNDMFAIFHNNMPVTEISDTGFGDEKNCNKNLQDTVDTALLHLGISAAY